MKKSFAYKSIGNRIKFLRGDSRTQEQFAALLGISLRTYQRYEQGERLPPFKMISKISNICDVSTDWIISGSDIKGREFTNEDFVNAVDKLEYLFDHGSFEFIDFFTTLLNYASNVARGGLNNEDGDDLIEFLTFITDMSSSKLRKAFDKRGVISYKYQKNGKPVSVAYRSKSEKNKNKNQK